MEAYGSMEDLVITPHIANNISYFKQLLKLNSDLEKQISMKTNTLYKHNCKWRLLLNIV